MTALHAKFDAVLFDWNGVLCRDRFYAGSFLAARPEALVNIQREFFEGDKSLINGWMRGHVGYREVHRRIAGLAGAEAHELDRALVESVQAMRLDPALLNFAARLKRGGVKTAIVTDNMDVFTIVTVPHHRLGGVFDLIVNSADCGLLKQDQDGRLFDYALHRLGAAAGRTLFIDDSPAAVKLFESKGGMGRHFTTAEALTETALTETTPDGDIDGP